MSGLVESKSSKLASLYISTQKQDIKALYLKSLIEIRFSVKVFNNGRALEEGGGGEQED
jgi:hypothetical protein